MYFKRAGKRIFGVQFNKAEQKALDDEITRQIVENDMRFDMDKEASILYMLHTQFGFGPKRLRKAWEQEDDGWLTRQKLKEETGIDLEEWYREESINVQTEKQ